ncbi:MAG: SUMF1/EgtB/PvdO family nonheme iron enzyme [Gammaproteobacteria bacterium]|jgi:formylglycine-generating enzyme required for sulfatase activity|nr:SUMF1/EgtB/PvdO family nonheme iron enzyme [Gammaproteobacteria bacterium]
MVILPRGMARIRAADREPLAHPDEYPSREVSFPDRFAMGVYEVTFDQWQACVSDNFCRTHAHPFEEGWGGGDRPVLNVSFDDITDRYGFIAWLNSKVPGTPYRLPSEAEWEYAARAGTDTWFQTGKIITDAEANFRASIPFVGSDTGIYRRKTLPVGSFAPNGFRLHDMFGNAMEWTADCWHPDHEGAPLTPAPRGPEDEGDCSKRVLRGGSWFSEPNELRAAFRARYDSDLRTRKAGFRVVRELETDARWVEFSGGYEVKDDRANIADAQFTMVRYSNPSDIENSGAALKTVRKNMEVLQGLSEDPVQRVASMRAGRDFEIVSVSATVENIPLEAHEHHFGDNCIYATVIEDGRSRLPRPAEVYCTSTSLWTGKSYHRELNLSDAIGLWLPTGNGISCPVDISVLLPETINEDAISDTRVTCRIEYRLADTDRPVGKFIRIPYLDQYPFGGDLIQPDRPWYNAWDDDTALKIHGAAVYFFPKPARDQVIEDICLFTLDRDGKRVKGDKKSLCFNDEIYVSGTNNLVHQADIVHGELIVEPGETLSGSCHLAKGNSAGDCAIFALAEIPDERRDSVSIAPLYVRDSIVHTEYLRNGYCTSDILEYRLTANGKGAISVLSETGIEPWNSLSASADGQLSFYLPGRVGAFRMTRIARLLENFLRGLVLAPALWAAACSPGVDTGSAPQGEEATSDAPATASEQAILETHTCLGCEDRQAPLFAWSSGEPGPQQTNFVRVLQAETGTRLNGRGGADHSGGHTAGAFFTLSGDAEAEASGKTVRVEVEVEVRGSEGQVLAVAYSTADVGNSGWQEFTLSGRREWVSFDYAVNPMREGNNDYIGLLPAEGESVRLHRLHVLEADSNGTENP